MFCFDMDSKGKQSKSRLLTTETHITNSAISVFFRKNVTRYAFCCFHNNSFLWFEILF